MGMNIYTKSGEHIGKRWAAGIWCWDCRVRLFVENGQYGHTLNACPRCGNKRPESPAYNPALRELGFDRSAPQKPTGIDGANGFIWAVGYDGLGDNAAEVKRKLKRYKSLVTEYGEEWSMEQFEDMFLQVIDEAEMDGEFS